MQELQGDVYEDCSLLRKTLVDNVIRFIDSIVDTAIKSSNEWYGVNTHKNNDIPPVLSNDNQNEVVLEPNYKYTVVNGIRTKVNLNNVPEEYREQIINDINNNNEINGVK